MFDEDIGNAFGNTLNSQVGSRFLLLAQAFFWSVTPVHSLGIATSRGIDDYDTDCAKLRYIPNNKLDGYMVLHLDVLGIKNQYTTRRDREVILLKNHVPVIGSREICLPKAFFCMNVFFRV